MDINFLMCACWVNSPYIISGYGPAFIIHQREAQSTKIFWWGGGGGGGGVEGWEGEGMPPDPPDNLFRLT